MFTFRRLSETADYTDGGGVCQANVARLAELAILNDRLNQIPNTNPQTRHDEQDEQTNEGNHDFEFSIALLVRWRERCLGEIRWWCVGGHVF